MSLVHGGSKSQRFPCLDGYRAIAALMVVCTHTAFHTAFVTHGAGGAFFSRLDFGVTLFFVISGFLLFRPWSTAAIRDSAKPRTKAYAIRRAARILPAYVLVVAVVLIILPTIRGAESYFGVWKYWVTHLSFTQIYVPNAQVRGLTQMWSLAVEVVFYVFLPLAGWWLVRRRRPGAEGVSRQLRFLFGLVVVGIVATVVRALWGPGAPLFVGFWLPAYLDWFAVGMIFAVIHEAKRHGIETRFGRALDRLAADPLVPVGIGVLILVIAMTPLAGPYILVPSTPFATMSRHYLYLMAAAMFIIPGLFGNQGQGLWRTFLQSPIMQFLGQISYGIFLWHLIVIELVWITFGWGEFSGPMIIALPVVVIVSIFAGWLSWIVVERPALAWSHRVTSNSTPPQHSTPRSSVQL